MHVQARNWINSLKKRFPDYFKGKKVLEIGSANINGTTRDLFTDCKYIGIDVQPFTGVDVVSIAHEYKAEPGSFDVVYSTSALEHDIYYQLTLKKMVELTKHGGLMFFQVDSEWPKHGVTEYLPEHSLTSKMGDEWARYYKNLKANDIVAVLDLNSEFIEWEMRLDSGMDLDFWGITR